MHGALKQSEALLFKPLVRFTRTSNGGTQTRLTSFRGWTVINVIAVSDAGTPYRFYDGWLPPAHQLRVVPQAQG